MASAGGGVAKSPEEAQARDRALLDLLQHGPASFERLASAVPGDFLTDDARSSACRLSLLRMKARGVIQVAPDGYAKA